MATKVNNNELSRPWRGASRPVCVSEKLPSRLPFKGDSKEEIKAQNAWRSTLGYDDTQISSHPKLPITNVYHTPCFVPTGMSTEPIHFPNLVTGFHENPQHAARTALNVRYTTQDWEKNRSALDSEAIRSRKTCELMKATSIELMRKTDEQAVIGYEEVTKHIQERLDDIRFWQKDLAIERDKAKAEVDLLTEMKLNIARCLRDLEAPMHIAQECLRHREGRQGVELERDLIEERLMEEVQNLRTSQTKFAEIQSEIDEKLCKLLKAQHKLEEDVTHKEAAIVTDTICRDLDTSSGGVAYRGGIEKTATAVTTGDSWTEASSKRVLDSQAERSESAEFRITLGTLIASIAASVHECYARTNWTFERGEAELIKDISKIQKHLDAVRNEKFQLDKYMFLLRKAIEDKSKPLMVAQTRLEARCHRQGLELCNDSAHRRLIQEITDIQDFIQTLYENLQEAEMKYDQLMKTLQNLDDDLKRKKDRLFIDREKCLGLRLSYPIDKMIKDSAEKAK